MRILLVEDDKKIASFILKGLKAAGFATDHTTDGKEGLHLALNEPYDAAVIDIMLPRNDNGARLGLPLWIPKALTRLQVLQSLKPARQEKKNIFLVSITVKNKGREIDLLATSFNQMLNRIQTLLMGIKEMSDNIAHDLKSPITRIRGISEITLTAGTSLDEYKNMAASTIEECDRLLDMINTMMVISETEAGVSRPESKEVDISGIVQSACELFQPIAEDKNLTITCDTPDRCVFPGNTRMIQRMIANLIDNGIKYTPAGGSIEISTQQTEEQSVIVLVKDTGIGISEKDLPHIFERFYRCDPSRSEAGIGLGLSLALAIARAHGGDITVDSTPGKGSTFMVTLPK